MQQNLICDNCGTQEAMFFCSRCEQAYYCSPACQSVHWATEHKNWCASATHIGIRAEMQQIRQREVLSGQPFMYLWSTLPDVMRRIQTAMKRPPGVKGPLREFYMVNAEVSAAECYQARQPGFAVFDLRDDGIYLFKCPAATGARSAQERANLSNEQMKNIARDLRRYANSIVHNYDLLNMQQLKSAKH